MSIISLKNSTLFKMAKGFTFQRATGAYPVLPSLTLTGATTSSYTVAITAYDPQFTYTISASVGTAKRTNGNITVSGLSANQLSTLTVTAANTDKDLSLSVSSGFLSLPPTPILSATGGTETTIEVTITNYNAALTYSIATTAGSVSRLENIITVSGVEQGQSVTITAISSNTSGNSSQGSLVLTPPAQITNLSATRGYQEISLSWTAPNNNGLTITDYLIQESSNQIDWSTVQDGVNVNTLYTRTGLSNGQLVYFRVSAINASGPGAYSNIASATTVVPKATGGTITFDPVSNTIIHTFTASETFTPNQTITANAVVVAGGYTGATSTFSASGAGGAGGKVTTGSTSLTASTRTITVGSINGGTSSISGWLSSSGVGVNGGAATSGNPSPGNPGVNGTTSSISGTSYVYGSSGGSGAYSTDYNAGDGIAIGGTGGTGAGNGGDGRTGSSSTPPPPPAGGGGGGGGGGA